MSNFAVTRMTDCTELAGDGSAPSAAKLSRRPIPRAADQQRAVGAVAGQLMGRECEDRRGVWPQQLELVASPRQLPWNNHQQLCGTI